MISQVCLAFIVAVAAPPESAFRAHVRPTDPLSAAEQRKTFHLPKGFRVELVAAEPQIFKPMNLAFDAAGRLWVSESIEYPYAAKDGKGRDRIQVLEDTNGDGRLDKTTTFVDGLNIPIGLLPYRDGVIAYSIPNIYFFRDTDGDGKCDRREVLYGPLGQPRDTHGMQNAFRRGFDGWIYVCHGFSNTSTISAKDGSSITLQSGNTYRIRPDGSRVEQFTWGQVNPFGSTFTPWGDLITADCHSKPLTLLIRGGYYSSFGKPHDGIGFVPPLMDHLHGSTAIAGAAYYTGENFPESYHGKLFVGNVVTSRVNCDSLKWNGATASAVEEEDFIRCDDPWFRPVVLQNGPDGALYIADFYNRIIGHYEVALDHPGRDRHRGRIWRVVYDPDNAAKPLTAPNLRRTEVAELIEAMGNPNLRVAKLALDEVTDRIGRDALKSLASAASAPKSPQQAALALWGLHRLGGLDDQALAAAYKSSDSKLLRSHIQRIIAESPDLTRTKMRMALAELTDASSPLAQRFAADALGRHGAPQAAGAILSTLETAADDPYLVKSLQIALRDVLKREGAYEAPAITGASAAQAKLITNVSLAVPNAGSAEYLLRAAKRNRLPSPQRIAMLSHIASQIAPERIDELIAYIRSQTTTPQFKESVLLSIETKLAARGIQPTAEVKNWAKELAAEWLSGSGAKTDDWRVILGEECWDVELRDCDDGQRNVPFLSSLPGGEKARSVLRSKPFTLPKQLTFYVCGHLGFPDKPAERTNYVVLRLANGQEIARAEPPRNDRAKQVRWRLPQHEGKEVFVEVVDQNAGGAYAWLAVSRFEPAAVKIPTAGRRARANRLASAARVSAAFGLSELIAPLKEVVLSPRSPQSARLAAARALTDLTGDQIGQAVIEIAALPRALPQWQGRVFTAIAKQSGAAEYETLLAQWMKESNRGAQRNASVALASNSQGAEILFKLIERGAASARLLQERAVVQRLELLEGGKYKARIEMLTAALPAPSLVTQQQIKATLDAFRTTQKQVSITNGRKLFEKNCQICHQVGGKGELIGPQLDGIGNRGVARVAEDLLDPNRNVDAQFRATSIVLNDGRVVTGLQRRREGNVIYLADEKGKEFTVNTSDIDEQKQSMNSLMPTNLTESLKPTELRDLLGYLASLRK